MNVNQITDTIILARFTDGKVREIKTSLWLSTANIIEKPLKHVAWDENFQVMHSETVKIADPMAIVETVCDYFGIAYEKVQGRSRKRPIVIARHMSAFLLRKFTALSHKDIGELLGRLDHTTSINATERMRDHIETEESLGKAYRELCAICSKFFD